MHHACTVHARAVHHVCTSCMHSAYMHAQCMYACTARASKCMHVQCTMHVYCIMHALHMHAKCMNECAPCIVAYIIAYSTPCMYIMHAQCMYACTAHACKVHAHAVHHVCTLDHACTVHACTLPVCMHCTCTQGA